MVRWKEVAKQLGFQDSKAMLSKLYLRDGKSSAQIGEKLACTGQTVRNKLKKEGIPLKRRGGARWPKTGEK